MTENQAINPGTLSEPIGFAHGVLSTGSSTLWLAGQCGYDRAGKIVESGDLVGQLDRAMGNIGDVLKEAEMEFANIVQLNFFVTSRDDYAVARREFGRVWKRHCGAHFPAMALFMVAGLFDLDALIEIQGVAVR